MHFSQWEDEVIRPFDDVVSNMTLLEDIAINGITVKATILF